MICLGIDPDTFNTGIALVEATDPTKASKAKFKVRHVAVAAVDRRLSVQRRILNMRNQIEYELWLMDHGDYVDRTCVEGQVHYPKSKVRPNDLIHLAQVAGMAGMAAGYVVEGSSDDLWFPEPAEWKGQAKKAPHQKQILQTVELNADLEGVTGASRLNTIQLGHVIDAIGLAVWVAQQPARRKA